MTDNEIKQIKSAARSSLSNHFDRLNQQGNSADLATLITNAIANAIEEYDRLRN